MKKLITLFALLAIVLGVNAQNIFEVGDKRIDINLGGGIINYAEQPKMTFDQHINLEWIVAKLGKKVSLGVGFALNNIYGGFKETTMTGEYNYMYTKTTTTNNKIKIFTAFIKVQYVSTTLRNNPFNFTIQSKFYII